MLDVKHKVWETPFHNTWDDIRTSSCGWSWFDDSYKEQALEIKMHILASVEEESNERS